MLSTTATVDALSVTQAVDYVLEAILGAVPRLEVELVEAMTEKRQDRELETSNLPDLVGLAEIAELAGTTRQRVFQMTANKGFPAAVLELRSGRLWQRPAIESYLEGRQAARVARVPAVPNVIRRASPEENDRRVITKSLDVTKRT